MQIEFRETTGGMARMRRHIRIFEANLARWDTAERKIAQVVRLHVAHQFSKGGSPRWAHRSRSYPHPWRPLMRTHTMHVAALRGVRGSVTMISKRRVQIRYSKFWAATPYARFHLTGTKYMPARPFAPPWTQLTSQERDQIGQIVRSNVIHGLKR